VVKTEPPQKLLQKVIQNKLLVLDTIHRMPLTSSVPMLQAHSLFKIMYRCLKF